MDYFYDGIQRLDWGFGNPNKTAAFIATLAVASGVSAMVWTKRVFWVFLAITTALCVFLIQTVSRGGMVACIGGLIFGIAIIRPRLTKWHYIAIGFSVAGLMFYAHFHGVADRYSQGIVGEEDRSISNRWLIYKSVPQMLWDAPYGWGKGNAAEAYMQWYQPIGRDEKYLNLVNSHFTWMVEWTTWKRILYCMAWPAVVLFCWPTKENKWWGISCSVWVTFFLAASFSSVAHHPWMWPFPLLLLISVLIYRLIIKRDFVYISLTIATLLGLASYFTLLAYSRLSPVDVNITKTKTAIRVGNQKPNQSLALIGDDKKILGNTVGHRIRDYIKKHPKNEMYFYTILPSELKKFDKIFYVGNLAQYDYFPKESTIILLNPSRLKDELLLDSAKSITIYWGQFNRSPSKDYWKKLSCNNDAISLITLTGQGYFLQNWLKETSANLR